MGHGASNRVAMKAPANAGPATDAGDDNEMTPSHGPYCLSGPVERADPRNTPVRGDLAHVALAGRYFVPHYALPQPRSVMPGGARLMSANGENAEEICTLMEGDSFEVLDVTGNWAWGCMSLNGPVGYVPVDRLEPLP